MRRRPDNKVRRVPSATPAKGRCLLQPVVRDAMKMLQGRGLVEVMQGRGTVGSDKLAEFSSDLLGMALQQQQSTLIELWEVRRILEVEIAGLAAQQATGRDRG